jgi:hypothetical protein
MTRLILSLVLASVAPLGGLRAEDSSRLILFPGSELTEGVLTPPYGGVGISADAKALSIAKPEILFERHLQEADFISAGWRDATGQLLHQRDVFLVKQDYCVVVDYLFGTDEHAVVRSFAFPKESVKLGDQSASCSLSNGRHLLVQSLDLASQVSQTSPESPVLFANVKHSPTPVTTVLMTWSGATAPKIETVKPHNPMIVKLKVTFPDGRTDELALAWESRPLHLGGKELRAWAACVRHGTDAGSSFEMN